MAWSPSAKRIIILTAEVAVMIWFQSPASRSVFV
jgi:hypothetical protein